MESQTAAVPVAKPAPSPTMKDAATEKNAVGPTKGPWRCVYMPGSKQRCAAVESPTEGVYIYLLVAQPDDTDATIERWKQDALLITNLANAHFAKPAPSQTDAGTLQHKDTCPCVEFAVGDEVCSLLCENCTCKPAAHTKDAVEALIEEYCPPPLVVSETARRQLMPLFVELIERRKRDG